MVLSETLREQELARQRRLAEEAAPISVVIPGFGEDNQPRRVIMTYAEAQMLAYELASALTRHAKSTT